MENKLDRATDIQELLDMAHRLSLIIVTSEDEIAAMGFMVGTVYALHRAATLQYDDARNNAGKDKLEAEFRRAANDLSKKSTPEPGWLAGFYFSSALMRLAALNERIDKMAGCSRDSAQQIRRIVNKLKHETDAHVRGNWSITFREVLQSARSLSQGLEDLLKVRHNS